MALTQTEVSQLYVAIFNRASEGNGNQFWQNTGLSAAAVADEMLATTDAEAYFGTSLDSNEAFINHIYLNTLNKGEGVDTAGKQFWIDALDSGEYTRGFIVAELVGAVEQYADSTDPATQEAYAQFTNRVVVSDYTADTLAAAPEDYATSLAFDGDLTVTSDDETIATASSAVDEIANPVTGETFILTTDDDTVTGTADNDAIDGVVSTLSSADTLDPTDTIDGGEGTDRADIELNTNFTGFTTGSMANVETIKLTNGSSVARSFDATGVTGATSYVIDANDIGVNLSDLEGAVDVSLSNLDAAANFSTAIVAGADELTATTDEMTFTINDLGVAEDPTTSATEQKVVTATLADIETVNVVATGTNDIAFAGTDLKNLNISGAGNVTVTSLPTSVTSFDASESTGDINADLTTVTGPLTTIATGSGDDTLTVDTALTAANATIAMDGGADTLALESAGTTLQYQMSGVETLALSDITGAVTFSGTNVTGLNEVTTVAANTFATSLVNMGASDLTVTAKGATDDGGDLSSDNSGAVTLDYTATAPSVTAKTAEVTEADFGFSAANALTVNVGEYIDTTGSDITAATADTVTLNVASGKTSASTPVEVTEFDGSITAAKATSLTVDAEGKLGANATINAAKALSATVTNGATAGELVLNAPDMETLDVTTGNTLDFTGSTLTGLQSLTATTSKGLVTFGDLADIASVDLAGAGTTSAVTLGNLGGANDYDMNLTATGLKGGLTVGTMDVNTGYDIIADVTDAAGAVTIGAIGSDGTTDVDDVTITAADVAGAVDIGAITAAGNVTVTGDTASTFDIGAIDAGTTGAVVVDLGGTVGVVTTGDYTGKTVDVDMSDTISGVVGSTYTVNAVDSATVAVSNLEASTVDVTAHATSTALSVDVTGGILDDAVTVTGGAAQTSITVTGDLDLGTDTLTVDSAASTENQTIDISSLLDYSTASITADAGDDIITGGAGVDTITGGLGADTMTGGAGADSFIVGTVGPVAVSTATSTDVITDFVGGTDEIQFAAAATFEVIADDGTIADDTSLADAVTSAFALTAVANDGGIEAIQFDYDGSTYFAIESAVDTNDAGAAVIDVTGVSGTVAAGDFVAIA